MTEEETDKIRNSAQKGRPIDDFDRKILSSLATDATLSYAALAKTVGLSAPAIHERVKRLRTSGVIKRTIAELDGPATGKPFLAFVLVQASGWGLTEELMEITKLPEVEEVHSGTGEAGIILKVRVSSTKAMEGFLWRLYETDAVQSTRAHVVLNTYLERGVQAGVTAELAEGEHLK